MHLNTLSPAEGSNPERKRVGRGIGSGLGKTAGRGHKGHKSRSGYSRKFSSNSGWVMATGTRPILTETKMKIPQGFDALCKSEKILSAF